MCNRRLCPLLLRARRCKGHGGRVRADEVLDRGADLVAIDTHVHERLHGDAVALARFFLREDQNPAGLVSEFFEHSAPPHDEREL